MIDGVRFVEETCEVLPEGEAVWNWDHLRMRVLHYPQCPAAPGASATAQRSALLQTLKKKKKENASKCVSPITCNAIQVGPA